MGSLEEKTPDANGTEPREIDRLPEPRRSGVALVVNTGRPPKTHGGAGATDDPTLKRF